MSKQLSDEQVRDLFHCFRSENSNVMPLWNRRTREWVCYFVPEDPHENGVFITHNCCGDVEVGINVSPTDVMSGYEGYLAMGFEPAATKGVLQVFETLNPHCDCPKCRLATGELTPTGGNSPATSLEEQKGEAK